MVDMKNTSNCVPKSTQDHLRNDGRVRRGNAYGGTSHDGDGGHAAYASAGASHAAFRGKTSKTHDSRQTSALSHKRWRGVGSGPFSCGTRATYTPPSPAQPEGGVRRGRDSGQRGTKRKNGEGEKEENPLGRVRRKIKTRGRVKKATHTHTHTHALRRTAEACCALGHHADDHIARRPQLQLCPLHGLPPCPRCTLKQRGVRHCCQRGHHKVCTPVPTRRKRPLAAHSQLPNKRPCMQGPARISTGLPRSPHQPPPLQPPNAGGRKHPPSVPTSPSATGAGGDRGRGCRTPAFRDEARKSKHSGYLASTLQRF